MFWPSLKNKMAATSYILMSNGVILLKGLISPLLLLLGVWDVKRICKKSRYGNISQVLNLTFNPCLTVNGVIILKRPYTCILLLLLGLQNVKSAHGKSWSANILPVNNFGLILKNKMAVIAN